MARHITSTVKEAERDEGWASACFLLFIQSGTIVCSGQDFQVQLNHSGNTLIDTPHTDLGLIGLTRLRLRLAGVQVLGW